MKTVQTIVARVGRLQAETASVLRNLLAACENDEYQFTKQYQQGDPRIAEVLQTIRGLGLRAEEGAVSPGTYDQYLSRLPEPTDFAAAELVQVFPPYNFPVCFPEPDRRPSFRTTDVPFPEVDLCGSGGGAGVALYARDSLKQKIEAEHFRDIRCVETQLVREFERGDVTYYERRPWKTSVGPWWQLSSPIRLWPPAEYFRESRGTAQPGLHPISEYGGHLMEPGYRNLVLAFRRDVVRQLGEFDLAILARNPTSSGVVVSRRLGEFLVKNQPGASLWPVLILDDPTEDQGHSATLPAAIQTAPEKAPIPAHVHDPLPANPPRTDAPVETQARSVHGTPTIEFVFNAKAKYHLWKAGVTQLCGVVISERIPFVLRFAEGSPQVEELTQTLRQLNLPDVAATPAARESRLFYQRRRVRAYSPESIAAAEYLLWEGVDSEFDMAAGPERSQGHLILAAVNSEARWSFDRARAEQLLWSCFPYLIASKTARAALEAAQFQGLAFNDVVLALPCDEDEEYDEDWLPYKTDPTITIAPCEPGDELYELTTDITLPPMASSFVLRHRGDGVPVPMDDPYSNLGNPHFDDFQPVYRRSDLPTFDAAFALEPRGDVEYADSKYLIVSQRLARKLLELTPQMTFRPVALIDH